MQMGARRRRPWWRPFRRCRPWPISRPRPCRVSAAIRSSFDQIHALAAKIAGLKADGVIVTQGTDTLEETSLPARPLGRARHPGDRDGGNAQSRAHVTQSGPGNLLAAVRVACDPWIRAHSQGARCPGGDAGRGLCRRRRHQDHPTRLNAFASTADRTDRGAGRRSRGAGVCRCATRSRRRAAGSAKWRAAPSRWHCCRWVSTSPAI